MFTVDIDNIFENQL